MNKQDISGLKIILEKHLEAFDFDGRLENDPVYYPHLFKDPSDIQAAAVIASCLAYGKVGQFFAVIGSVMAALKTLDAVSPYRALLGYDSRDGVLGDISYRFNKSLDLEIFLESLGLAFKKYGTPCDIIESNYSKSDSDIMSAASAFVKIILAAAEKISASKYKMPLLAGVSQLLPDPGKNSTCKRLCMLLRWLTRGPDKIDFGIIKKAPASKLIIPLDTHIFRIAKMLGLTNRRDQSLKTAAEITASLKLLDPLDPLKYDFALCHIGISGLCKKGAEGKNCRDCPLAKICNKKPGGK
jgi:uncharacterized protein (TIGR02757 family)